VCLFVITAAAAVVCAGSALWACLHQNAEAALASVVDAVLFLPINAFTALLLDRVAPHLPGEGGGGSHEW
jgi:hypothetical protein